MTTAHDTDTAADTAAAIELTVETFLKGWSRSQWMAEHGTFASAEWDEERDAYDAARAELEKALKAAPAGDRLRDPSRGLSALREAFEALEAAAIELESQVCPDESDYVSEGTIDPDGVAKSATQLDVGHTWRGWDCTKGWDAVRHGRALYVHWWRTPHGRTRRHHRDLWVLVAKDYFDDADTDEAAL